MESVRTLIARGWTQRAMARTTHDSFTTPHAADAARYCLAGACQRATPAGGEWRDVMGLLGTLLTEEGHASVLHYNDHPNTTQTDVLALLDDILATIDQEMAAREEKP